MKIDKLSKVLLVVLLFNLMLMDVYTPFAKADDLPKVADNKQLLSLVATKSEAGMMTWQLMINQSKQKLTSNQVRLELDGKHQLDRQAFEQVLNENDIMLSQKDASQNEYILTLKDLEKAYILNLVTATTDRNETDYTAEAKMDYAGKMLNAKDGVYQMQSLNGKLSYKNVPTDEKALGTTVQLINTKTNQIIQEKNLTSEDQTFTFDNVRKFDDEKAAVSYNIKTIPLPNYETTIKDANITQKYLTTSIEGKVDNQAKQDFEIEAINKATNEVVKTVDVLKDATSYKIDGLPMQDANGNKIAYSIQASDNVKAEIEGFDISLQKDEKAETKATTVDKKTAESEAQEESVVIPSTEDMGTSEAFDEDTLKSTSNDQTILVERSVVFKPMLRTFDVSTFAVGDPKIDGASYNYSTNTINQPSLTATIKGTISGDGSYITWEITLQNKKTSGSLTINLKNITFVGLTPPTTFDAAYTGGSYSTPKSVTNNGNGNYSIDNQTVNGTYKITNIRFITPIAESNLATYKVNIGSILDGTNGLATNLYGAYNVNAITATPTVNQISPDDIVITGTSEPNATIVVKNAAGTQIGTTTADSSGKYSVPITKQAPNSTLTVTAQVSGKGVSNAVTVKVLPDATPPDAPVVLNDYVDASTKVINGTAEAGATIEALFADGTKATGTVDATGKYSLTIPAQKAGNTILMTAIDSSGNRSKSTAVTVQDTVRTTIGLIYDNQTRVIGTAEAGSIITITDASGKILGSSQVDASGSYYVELYRPLPAGTVITAQAKTADGKLSNTTSTTVLSSSGVPTPGNGLPIEEPSPTYKGDVKNMSWDERGLYRNRVPQPVEYLEGYLWKAAQPTSNQNEYAIDLKTQGRETTTTQPTDIVLVVDNSGSMSEKDAQGRVRWDVMKTSVNNFIDQVTAGNATNPNSQTRIAVVNFASDIVSQTGFQSNATAIKTAIPANYQTDRTYNTGTAHTFTQKGLLAGETILKTSPNSNKIMIVITDGAPTFSYKGTAATGPESITSFDYSNRVGNGAGYLLNFVATNPANSRDWRYTLNGFLIENHGQPTISEAKNIRARNPGFNIFSIGLDINKTTDQATVQDMAKVLNSIASKPENAFSTTDTAAQLPNILGNIAQVTMKSIYNGVITDPIGEMYDLNLGSNGIFDASDYTLTASDPALLNGVTVTYDVQSRTLKLNGLTLGKGEWVNINYKVKLRTDDAKFQDNTWYAMNGRTTLQPKTNSNILRDYPIPEAKYSNPVYNFTFNKVDDADQPLAGAVFTVTDNAGKVVESTSAASGVVQFTNLKAGTYTLVEKSAPAGYTLDAKTRTVVIKSDGLITVDGTAYNGTNVLNVKNTKQIGSLEVLKYRLGDETAVLRGATFELRNPDNSVVQTLTTGADGKVIFNNLSYGNYLLVETKAPAGYVLDSAPKNIAISSTNSKVSIKVANKLTPSTLPNTGGMGTVAFTVVGLALIALAIWLKRRSNK